MDINKQQLINEVQSFLHDIEIMNPKKESLEWYLVNNLKKYLKELISAETITQIKKSTEIIDIFCVESMDWNTALFKRCTKITELGLKITKNS